MASTKKSTKQLKVNFTKKQTDVIREAMAVNDIKPSACGAFLAELAKVAGVRASEIEMYG